MISIKLVKFGFCVSGSPSRSENVFAHFIQIQKLLLLKFMKIQEC